MRMWMLWCVKTPIGGRPTNIDYGRPFRGHRAFFSFFRQYSSYICDTSRDSATSLVRNYTSSLHVRNSDASENACGSTTSNYHSPNENQQRKRVYNKCERERTIATQTVKLHFPPLLSFLHWRVRHPNWPWILSLTHQWLLFHLLAKCDPFNL